MPDLPDDSPSLLEVLTQQIMPRVQQRGVADMVVARASCEEFQQADDLPDGVRLSPKPLRGRRTVIRGRRLYDQAALVEAKWIKDGLHAIRVVKLCFVLQGPVAFQVADTIIHADSGHIILIPPGIAHPDGSHTHLDETCEHNGGCELLMLMPHANGVECWLSHTRDGRHWSHRSAHECARILHPHLPFYFEALLNEAGSARLYNQEVCAALLQMLLLLTARETEAHGLSGRPEALASWPHGEASGETFLARAEAYIHQHLHEKLTIDKVARHTYLARSRFTRAFRRETGKSFNEYLCDCRLEAAKRLLTDGSNWPIERISGFVGLQPGRLRALFHQRVGMAPTLFRALHSESAKEKFPIMTANNRK
jgi:AraC-like DNA-binding protein